MPGDVLKSPAKMKHTFDFPRKNTSHIDLAHEKYQVTVPLIKSEKISNPSFLQYQEKIRNKIRDRANSYVHNPQFSNGEVYLSFIITSQGNLRETRVIENKTKANNFLRSIALRSIKESHPYPAFPKDLDYAELPFNIVISFKVKK